MYGEQRRPNVWDHVHIDDFKGFISVRIAAERFGVAYQTIQKWANNKEVESLTFERKTYVDPKSVRARIANMAGRMSSERRKGTIKKW